MFCRTMRRNSQGSLWSTYMVGSCQDHYICAVSMTCIQLCITQLRLAWRCAQLVNINYCVCVLCYLKDWTDHSVLAAFALYAFLGFAMDGPASLITSMIGLEIAPHFNRPFLSESVTSFWGKRWNLTVSNCLRGPVYDPIYEGTATDKALLCGCL